MLLRFTVPLLLALLSPTDHQLINVKTVFELPSWLIKPTTPQDDVLAANYVTDEDFYQIRVDVSSLDPDQIRITILDRQTIQIEGKRVSKSGGIDGDVERKFAVPLGYDVDKFSVDIDQNGVLRVAVPRKGGKA